MQEALTLFDSIYNSWRLQSCIHILLCFLFHTDAHLLDPVLERDRFLRWETPLFASWRLFPDYQGGSNYDTSDATTFSISSSASARAPQPRKYMCITRVQRIYSKSSVCFLLLFFVSWSHYWRLLVFVQSCWAPFKISCVSCIWEKAGHYKFHHWHVILVLLTSLGLGCLARSLAALVLDVIFGNYTLIYVASFIFFPHPFLPLSFFFSWSFYPFPFFLSFFFYLLFIVNNHPWLASLILLPFPLSPPSCIPLIPFVIWTFFLAAPPPRPLVFVHPMSHISALSQYCVPPPLVLLPLLPPALSEMNQCGFFSLVFLLWLILLNVWMKDVWVEFKCMHGIWCGLTIDYSSTIHWFSSLWRLKHVRARRDSRWVRLPLDMQCRPSVWLRNSPFKSSSRMGQGFTSQSTWWGIWGCFSGFTSKQHWNTNSTSMREIW